MKKRILIFLVLSNFDQFFYFSLLTVKCLRANPTKWSNTLKQFVGNIDKINDIFWEAVYIISKVSSKIVFSITNGTPQERIQKFVKSPNFRYLTGGWILMRCAMSFYYWYGKWSISLCWKLTQVGIQNCSSKKQFLNIFLKFTLKHLW